MGLFRTLFARSSSGKGKVSVSAFASDAGNGMSLQDAAVAQRNVMKSLQGDNVDAKINGAAQLLTGGRFEEAIDAYRTIGEQHPDQFGTCEGQIGAALYFLGRYEDAVTHYETALRHGADKRMMADNIEEAREAIRKRS